MAKNNMSKEEWERKDRLSYFFKAVNTMLISEDDWDLEGFCKSAKKIVDYGCEAFPVNGQVDYGCEAFPVNGQEEQDLPF